MNFLLLAAPFTDVRPGLIIWTLITFVIVFFLLRRMAWGPILKAVDEREKAISGSIEAAKRERAEAEKLLGEQKTAMAPALPLRSSLPALAHLGQDATFDVVRLSSCASMARR